MKVPFSIQVAGVQFAMGDDIVANVGRAGALVAEAAARGAHIVLLPELFASRYFPRAPRQEHFALAHAPEQSLAVQAMRVLARTHQVVLPVSYFERDGSRYFNSVIVFDADGSELGRYRKSHIPDGPGYDEKFFFAPGDTGFRVFDSRYGRIGVGICWDQWFPEAARAMALMGADVLFYPTAIGSEPHDASLDTRDPWRRAMQGHAVSNVIPVVASNRIGVEKSSQRFYGSSFIADHRGDLVASFDREEEGVLTHTFDLDFLDRHRAAWGFFRDRRTEFYR